MGDGFGKLKIIQDHFEASTSTKECPQVENPSNFQSRDNNSLRLHKSGSSRKKIRKAVHMLNIFSLRGLPWGFGTDDQEKVELSAAEVESLRSELATLEEREAHLKAQLQHVDEILRSARLSGYLYIRTRWPALPGEPLPIDDAEVDDWIPRFLVLHGSCIFLYLRSTDLSPQDSTLLSDITEVGALSNLVREDEETRHCFYISTSQGLRYECSSISKTQVESWLLALEEDCKLGAATKVIPNGFA